MATKKISQFNGYNLVDSELRTQIGEIDLGGKTLVAALKEKASAADLQTNKDAVDKKIDACEKSITAAVKRIDSIIGSAPETFDTFKEVSDWITKHGEDFEALKNSVNNLPDINAMLQSYVTISALTEKLNDYALKSEIPTATSQLTNDSGFLTEHQDISGLATNERVQELSNQIPTKVSQLNNDAGFIDNSALSNYSPTTDIEATFAKKTEIPVLDDYAKTADIELNYAKKSDVTSVYKVKGSLSTAEDFPANPEVGDVYDVESSGMNYVWTGTKWDPLGSIIDMSPYALNSVVDDKISKIPAPGIAEVEYGEFKLDGVVTKPVNGVVRIPAVKGKAKHTLSGYLKGRVVVDNSNSIVKGDGNTTLILDNCYINNAASGVDDASTAIYYEPDVEKLIIKLNSGSFNYIVNSGEKTGTFTENSGEIPTGAIHSNHDVRISGLGYLSIVTTAGGHGIKCKSFETEGKTHIYVEAYHDGIHCDKASEIKNAYIFVNKANDGIQCEEVLKAYLTEFHFANCVGHHMRGAVGSFYAGCTLEYSADKFENIMQISGSLYAGITKTCVKAVPNTTTGVYSEDSAPEAILGDVVIDDTLHTITSTYKEGENDEGVLIAGNWGEYELIVNMTDANSKIAAVILDGAILKKITLKSADPKLNIKSNPTAGDKLNNTALLPNVILEGISANADVTINCDQDIAILNNSGDTAITASEVSLKGDGFVFVKGSAKAACGSKINFGADGGKDSKKGKKSSGDFYINGDLVARLSGKRTKGDIVVYSNHTGDTYAENMISAANKISYTIATTTNKKGETVQINGGDVFALSSPGSFETLKLYSEPFKYVSAYKTSAQLINNNVDELSKKINAKLLAKANKGITLAEYGITDAYTKAEVDGKIPALDGYAKTDEISTAYATKAELSTVSAKLPEVPTEDGTYTLKATVVSGSVTYSWVKEAA